MADVTTLPDSYESLFRQAAALADRGDKEGALRLFQRIVNGLSKLSPATIERHDDMAVIGFMAASRAGSILASLRRYDEAVAMQRSALQFSPGSIAAVDIGVAAIRAEEGSFAEARDILTAALAQGPQKSGAWCILAYVLARLGDVAGVEASLDKATAAASRDIEKQLIALTRFEIAAWGGDVEKALAAWDVADLIDANEEPPLEDLYAFLLERGETTQLRRYLRGDRVPARAGLMRGILAQREGNMAGARRQWEDVIALDPTQLAAGHLDWVEAALRLGERRQAAALMSADPPGATSTRGLLLRAIIAAGANQLTSARNLLTTGTEILAGQFPWERRYGFADWNLFTTLVDNRAAWKLLQEFFQTQPQTQPDVT